MTKTKKPDETTSESLLDEAVDTLHFGLKAIRKEIEKIQKGKAKANGHDAGSRIAFLTQKVGAIADSVRKVEAARAKRRDFITPALILAWFRELGAKDRAQLVREIQEIDNGRSSLA